MADPDKILLVEDSEPLRKVLSEKLRDEEFLVYEAGGGEEGVRMAEESRPDLILTDIVMFPIDGVEMARRIRESGEFGRNVHIIALTNQNDAEEHARIEPLHFTDYLVKADTGLDEVVKRVKEILRGKKAHTK
ncbi:MAG TPA: response regulator [Candidatus Paceibacterota bacterium]|nr:response regulator [Candidatus Paceibacterota bacterium]